ncbi:MAG TPA: hypothetical protein ENK67_08370 [Flavobacteriia bacterium]|nr:hypothetical protein [Flavobacteriia bacterium]
MKQNILLSLLIILIINFSGCSNESNQETTYEKKNETLSLETEPKSYRNNPIMFSAWQNHGNVAGQATNNHSMPVIGYKREYYKGSCWKRVLPEKKWLLVDTTWMSRGYIRFDMKSNYWKFGTMTYVRSW